MKPSVLRYAALSLGALLLSSTQAAVSQSKVNAQPKIDEIDEIVREVMATNDIPGMAVGISVGGEHHYFDYGLASIADGRPVTRDTLFEIGSISKVFTATLGAFAQQTGALSLSDNASKHLAPLKASAFDNISLLNLLTYTAGGLPLQMPDDVTVENYIGYYTNWRPVYGPGTHRQYSNSSIGLFGHLVARSLDTTFTQAMENQLFPSLGLKRTYIRVPQERMQDYAYGYSKDGTPIHVNPGIWDAEAYGVKTSAADLLHFVDLNLKAARPDTPLAEALRATHTGLYKVGPMVQAMGWERYALPANKDAVLRGNSSEMALKANKAEALTPPLTADEPALFNKTGSTNGFGGYVAFVPSQQIGIVILANKNYPNAERVLAAYQILEALEHPLDGQPRKNAN